MTGAALAHERARSGIWMRNDELIRCKVVASCACCDVSKWTGARPQRESYRAHCHRVLAARGQRPCSRAPPSSS